MNFIYVVVSWVALMSVMFGLSYLDHPNTVIKIDSNIKDMFWCIGGVILVIAIVVLAWFHIPNDNKPE